jgi:DUF1016 N-terminal domain
MRRHKMTVSYLFSITYANYYINYRRQSLCYAEFVENSLQLPSGYQEFLQNLKGRIRAAQVQAAFAVNRELILLYWSIGRDLSQRFATEEWGGKIIDRLAQDLQT